MKSSRAGADPGEDRSRRVGSDVVTIGVTLAVVTAAVCLPQLLTDPGDFAPVLSLVWLGLLLSAAPALAAFLGSRRRVPMRAAQLVVVSLPQLLVTVGMARLDTWLEVRSGYLLAGSGEEAMS